MARRTTKATAGTIRAGIGGWNFEPWRGVFYPDKLAQSKELAYASERLTAIEINSTYYGTQKPETFRKWARETPEGFVFTVKGSRFATNRRVLAEAGDSVRRFVESGVTELGSRLGPLLWQFAPTKKFDETDFAAFLELLPPTFDNKRLQHAVEVRHDSFCTPVFIKLLRTFEIPVVFADHATYPAIADVTGPFVYMRLQQGEDRVPTAYPPKEIARWTERAQAYAAGGVPDDLPRADPVKGAKKTPRDVFVYFIHEGKVRAPAAAMALIERLRS